MASSASLAIASSLIPCRGERGSAIRPVRADSRIPKGAISFKNESILDCLAELENVSYCAYKHQIWVDSHFDNAARIANIEHLTAELVGEVGD